MESDFEIEPGLTFGNWLRKEIEDEAFVERNGFFPDEVMRVSEKLQRERAFSDRFEVCIPWMRIRTAFTAPGKYIYFSRGLLERLPNDETVAFVIAHEIAHHDLGHLTNFRGPFARRAAKWSGGQLLVLFFRVLQKRIYSPQWECDADRAAIKMCIKAGYDGGKCLRVFDILEAIALDAGDLTGVYGFDTESDQELSPTATYLTKARIWIWQHERGYLPIQDRAAAVREYLVSITKRSEQSELVK